MAAGAARHAWAPARMPASTPQKGSPVSPDGAANAGPLPINQTATAEAMNVAAFKSIAVARQTTRSDRS